MIFERAFFLIFLMGAICAFPSNSYCLDFTANVAYGPGVVKSKGLEEMNLRLGHSLRLVQPKKHENIQKAQFSVGIVDENQMWHFELGFSQFSDQIEGQSTFGEDISLVSSLDVKLILPQIGLRLIPGSSRLYRTSIRGLRDRLYLYGFVGLGAMSITHDYSYLFPEQGTAIEYGLHSKHILASMRLRFAVLLGSSLDVIFDLEYLRTMGLSQKSQLRQFTLYHQDMSYRSELLDLDDLISDGLSSVSVLLGLRFITTSL